MNMLNVSVSPHIRDKSSTKKIMIDVAIALLPTVVFGICYFGMNALFVTLASVLSCVLSELVFELITKRPITVFDFSAVVTGLILAVNMPPNVAWWIPTLGGVFAIIIVKMLFGGLGQNFMNPALAGRCFLLISFASRMTDFSVDGVSSATPLAILKAGDAVNLKDLLIGFHPGCIGEVSAIAILIGALYLIAKKVITIKIPGVLIVSAMVFIFIFNVAKGNGVPSVNYMAGELLSGGLLVGAFFMATDYVTSPITNAGQIIYAILIGFLVAVFRVLGSSSEGVSYAIIISNLVVPIIEKATIPKAFGCEKKGRVSNV